MPKAAFMRSSHLATLAPMILVALSGCATPVDGPSLAPRAVERFTAAPPTPEPTPPPIQDDASEQQRIAALVAQARDGDARFQAQLAAADPIVVQGASATMGSEAWVQAQQALSRAENMRTTVSQSLADLDALQIATVQNGNGTVTSPVLGDAISEVATIDVSEDRALQVLRDRLSAP
jgi:hypothetical protein